jgi:hypothetical protein
MVLSVKSGIEHHWTVLYHQSIEDVHGMQQTPNALPGGM